MTIHHSDNHSLGLEHLQEVLQTQTLNSSYHRLLTVVVLLPDDEAKRNIAVQNLAVGEQLGNGEIIAACDGHALLEREALETIAKNSHDMQRTVQLLVTNHNATLWEIANQSGAPVPAETNERAGLTRFSGFKRFKLPTAFLLIVALLAFNFLN